MNYDHLKISEEKKEILHYLENVQLNSIFMGNPDEYEGELDEIADLIDDLEQKVNELIDRIKFPEDYN